MSSPVACEELCGRLHECQVPPAARIQHGRHPHAPQKGGELAGRLPGCEPPGRPQGSHRLPREGDHHREGRVRQPGRQLLCRMKGMRVRIRKIG